MRGFLFFIICIGLCCCSSEEDVSEICFVGDSITNLWDVKNDFPGYYIHKHAVNGAKIEDLDAWNMDDCVGKEIVFLMGTNNIGAWSSEDTSASQKNKNFIKMLIPRLERLKAKPLLYITILPRNFRDRQRESVNKNIDDVNIAVKNVLDSIGMEYKYVDAFSSFLEGVYTIKKNLFVDGLHPNRDGYDVLTRIILPNI